MGIFQNLPEYYNRRKRDAQFLDPGKFNCTETHLTEGVPLILP
jgi:hypothetical protein